MQSIDNTYLVNEKDTKVKKDLQIVKQTNIYI